MTRYTMVFISLEEEIKASQNEKLLRLHEALVILN